MAQPLQTQVNKVFIFTTTKTQRPSSLNWGTGVSAPFDLKVFNPQSREGNVRICQFVHSIFSFFDDIYLI